MSLSHGTTLLYNPSCSKCRAALGMLEERGVEVIVREYLQEPLSREELGDLHELLGLPPIDWVRTGEAEWGEAGLSAGSDPEQVLDAIAAAPRLLQRPILIKEGAALVGRPPERLLQLLEG